MLPIVLDSYALSPSGSCLGEVLVAFTDVERLTVDRCGTSVPYRASSVFHPEHCSAFDGYRHRDVVGAGHGSFLILDREVVSGELVVTGTPILWQLPGFDHRSVLRVVKVFPHFTSRVCRICQHVKAVLFALEELDANQGRNRYWLTSGHTL